MIGAIILGIAIGVALFAYQCSRRPARDPYEELAALNRRLAAERDRRGARR